MKRLTMVMSGSFKLMSRQVILIPVIFLTGCATTSFRYPSSADMLYKSTFDAGAKIAKNSAAILEKKTMVLHNLDQTATAQSPIGSIVRDALSASLYTSGYGLLERDSSALTATVKEAGENETKLLGTYATSEAFKTLTDTMTILSKGSVTGADIVLAYRITDAGITYEASRAQRMYLTRTSKTELFYEVIVAKTGQILGAGKITGLATDEIESAARPVVEQPWKHQAPYPFERKITNNQPTQKVQSSGKSPGSPSVSAWGIGITGGYWKMDGSDMTTDMDYHAARLAGGKITQGILNPEAEVFYETSIKPDILLGGSAGYGMTSSIEYKSANGKIEGETTIIPISIYAKYKPESTKLSLFGGMGGDIVMARVFVASKTNPYAADAILPHIVAGGEYFLGSNFSLGINAKYIFAGEVDGFSHGTTTKSKLVMVKNSSYPPGEYLSASQSIGYNQRLFKLDYTGLRLNFAVRYYIG